MLSYIYDFLSIFFDKLKDKEKIKTIILFGSVARGTPRKDSDIDIFIDVEKFNQEEIRSVIQESLNEFELKAAKNWHLKGIDNPIVPIIGTLSDQRWSALNKEIANTGIILYRKHRSKHIEGKQKVLVTYKLAKCRQKHKMRILRKLYGYILKKGKKQYIKSGLLASFKGEKISNALLIDSTYIKILVKELRALKIPFTTRNLWIE